MNAAKPRVVIVQRRLTHYRVPFFSALRVELARRGVALDLLVGRGTDEEASKKDGGTLDWARTVPTYYAAGEKLCWQRLQPYLNGADLVIVTQENKLLHNFPLLLNGRRPFKLAFWGHGANLQSGNPRGLKERFKQWTSRRVDWWFAYTETSAKLVEATGFPLERITTVNNAVDTLQLIRYSQSITPDEIDAMRRELRLEPGPVGIFVGSLYPEKRLDFLFEAAQGLRARIPDFQLVVVGDGPQREKVRSWCEEHAWSRWLGVRQGREKVVCLKVAKIMLSPGALGLGVLDSFAAKLPAVVTCGTGHGPEIAYLENGKNGLITANNLDAYTHACATLLASTAELDKLGASCGRSALEYTEENMVKRFANGVCDSLKTPPYRRLQP